MSRILTTLHGNLAGLNSDRMVQCGRGFKSGEHGSQRTYGSPYTVEFWDDFVGDVIEDQWNYVEGAAGQADAAILAGGIGGVVRLTTGAVGTAATDLTGLTQALQWQASNGNLSVEARFKISAITNCYMFFGFTDVVTVEAPITLSGTTFTTTASDAVGFLFDTAATTDTWRLTGVAADVDATMQDTGLAPVADTYATFRISLSATGVATFYYNGVQVGTAMSGAVTAATDLTPCIYATVNAAAARTVDVDYMHVSMKR